MIPFNERLTMILNAIHLSPGDFGRSIDMSRVSVRKILNGETKPSLDTLERICALDDRISSDFLLKGVGGPLSQPAPAKKPDNSELMNLLFEVQNHMNEFVIIKTRQLSDGGFGLFR